MRSIPRHLLLLLTLSWLLPATTGATEVAVLGYHDFTKGNRATEMRLPIKEFERQMQVLADNRIEVISMADFLAWKRGEKELAEQAVVITIDDGWLSTYQLAFPVLKRFNFPFTLFLYTNYIDVGGRSLTSAMIKEMSKHGCTVGSHSLSHPYPSEVKKQRRKGDHSFRAWLKKQMGSSMKELRQKLPPESVLPCYAYPGGFHLPEMKEVGAELDYRAMFTVIPRMATFETPDFEIPRFVVLGTHPRSFTRALEFSSGIFDPHAPRVWPGRNLHITNREPEIRIEFPSSNPVIPSSIKLKLSEVGELPLTWDPNTRSAIHQVTTSLRSPSYELALEYQSIGREEIHRMNWTFFVDRELTYTPDLGLPDELPEPVLEPLPDK